MKKTLGNLEKKLGSNESKFFESGFLILAKIRGGEVPVDQGSDNGNCSGTNPVGCINRTHCESATNNYYCHNLLYC